VPKRLLRPFLSNLALASALVLPAAALAGGHAIALHGEPKYGPDFEHFEYVDPGAPKGGSVRLSALGTFDSLHPWILRGVPAQGLSQVFDTLTTNSADEPFTEYGLIAETIEVDPEGYWVRFTLRPEARFHDGEPVTVDDVIWTFETLREKGHPSLRSYYRDVTGAEQTGEHEVTFHFEGNENAELPLIVGQMPVLPEHWWADREFDRTTLDKPLGSGPYRVAEVRQGRHIVYERVEDYWAEDLPVKRGRHNFDRIRYDYYRDADVALEAFRAGEYDFRQENIARNWANAYDFSAVRDGRVQREEIDHEIPTGMQGFFINTRKDRFSDPRVREALSLAFDFEWTNRNLFHDGYTRSRSYFSNSELAAEGAPSDAELEMLEPYRDDLPEALFEAAFEPPSTEGERGLRRNLRQASQLLAEAGWEVDDGRLVHTESGERMRFEVLLDDSSFERVVLPWRRNLERLGMDVSVRTVDTSQYQSRMDDFDFDVTVQLIGQSNSPGNEQRNYWSCAAAETPGSRNYAGICDEAVDALIERIIHAPDRDTLVAATRALDRVLLHGHYVVPHWHLPAFRLAYWDKFGRPETSPTYSLGFDTWWYDEERAADL